MRTFRMAAIQAFEVTYELSIKLVRRSLEAKTADPAAIDAMDFKDIMRLAAEARLIDDPPAWSVFRAKRNISSHTYDEAKALDVIDSIPRFATHSRRLLTCLDTPHAPVS